MADLIREILIIIQHPVDSVQGRFNFVTQHHSAPTTILRLLRLICHLFVRKAKHISMGDVVISSDEKNVPPSMESGTVVSFINLKARICPSCKVF